MRVSSKDTIPTVPMRRAKSCVDCGTGRTGLPLGAFFILHGDGFPNAPRMGVPIEVIQDVLRGAYWFPETQRWACSCCYRFLTFDSEVK